MANKDGRKLIGRRIVDAVVMNETSHKSFMWSESPICLLLDDGTLLIPAIDAELNQPGVLYASKGDKLELIV